MRTAPELVGVSTVPLPVDCLLNTAAPPRLTSKRLLWAHAMDVSRRNPATAMPHLRNINCPRTFFRMLLEPVLASWDAWMPLILQLSSERSSRFAKRSSYAVEGPLPASRFSPLTAGILPYLRCQGSFDSASPFARANGTASLRMTLLIFPSR